MVRTLLHAEILKDGAAVHLTRATLRPTRPKSLHTHDFFEVFWVQNGKVRHHTETGMQVLEEGDCVMLPTGAAHALQGKGDFAMVTSLCLRPDIVLAMGARHPQLQGQLLWSDAISIASYGIQQLTALNQSANALAASNCDALAAEAFLAPFCAGYSAPDDALPDWLSRACDAARAPAVFRKGAAGFVAITGKAHPHVSRTMRALMGQSPSEFVNTQRMTYAARALVSDADPIATIADNCGIPNMAHFHKLFRAHHGMTPLQFRQQFQRDIVQPEAR